MSGAVVAFVEHAGGEADRLSLEALALARGLAKLLGKPLDAVVLGSQGEAVARRLGSHGVGLAHTASDARLDDFAPAAWAASIRDVIERRSPAAIVAAGSERGYEVLSDRESSPPVVVVNHHMAELFWPGQDPVGKTVMAGDPVRLLTVAPHAVAVDPLNTSAPAPTITRFEPELEPADLVARVVGREAKTSAGVSLTDAKVVIGGGRGVGSAAGFAQLEQLASLMNGAVGGSRVVTSLGWRPHSDQIGQTGLRIAPDLYVACGISGAIQHIVGCKAAKRILAINTDPDSPIMAVADYAVIGDLNSIVPAITAEIERRREAGRPST